MKLLRIAVAILLTAGSLEGQGWFRLPNNELGYEHDLVSTGVFRCGSSRFLWAGGSCETGQNSLTLRSANGTLRLSFAGLAQRIVATNVQSAPIVLGRMTVAVDGDFSNLGSSAVNAPVFFFNLVLQQTAPLVSSSAAEFGFTSRTPGSFPFDCCVGSATFASLPLTQAPDGFRYFTMAYDRFSFTGIGFSNDSFDITARVGLLPEPSTVVLTAVGLVLLAGGVARKRRA